MRLTAFALLFVLAACQRPATPVVTYDESHNLKAIDCPAVRAGVTWGVAKAREAWWFCATCGSNHPLICRPIVDGIVQQVSFQTFEHAALQEWHEWQKQEWNS